MFSMCTDSEKSAATCAFGLSLIVVSVLSTDKIRSAAAFPFLTLYDALLICFAGVSIWYDKPRKAIN